MSSFEAHTAGVLQIARAVKKKAAYPNGIAAVRHVAPFSNGANEASKTDRSRIGGVDGACARFSIDGGVGVIIHFGEDVVFPFEFGDPVHFEAIFHDLEVDAVEAGDVVARTFFGVLDGGVGGDDERPVGGLSEDEFASGLVEGASEIAVGVGEFSGQLDHAFFGAVQVGVNPVVSVVEPDLEEAVGTPARQARHDFLVDCFDAEVFARRDHHDFVLIASGFPHEHFEELRTFVPPVAVEFGVVGGGDMGRRAEDLFEVTALSLTVEEEVSGVFCGGFGGPSGDVGFFAVEGEFSGDAEVFKPSVTTDAVGMEVGFDLGVGEIEAAIAIEFAIIGVTWVTDFGAPDLSRAFEIASEGGDATRGDDGTEGAVAGGGIGLGQAVGFEDKERNAVFGEQGVDAGHERAFGEPNAAWGASEVFFIVGHGDGDLRASRLVGRHEGQETVGATARDDFEGTLVLEGLEDG